MSVLELTHRGAVTEILINRPDKKNALRDEDFVALAGHARRIAASDARAVMIHGAGGTFCAGRDIGDTDPRSLDAEKLIKEQINPTFLALRAIPVPTIAAVHGPCLGGGLGIAFACDIVLVADDARLGSPFRNIGSIADSGAHHYFERRLGYHRACELIFTGRFISGEEAARIGLVNRSHASGELLAEARRMADDLAAGPTAAFRCSKRIMQGAGTLEEVLAAEAVGQQEMFQGTADAAEGFKAFQEKRKPRFTGR